MTPLVAVSIGCPCGVGPEVAVAAAARARGVRCVLVGDEGVVRRAARIAGVDGGRIVRVGGTREEAMAVLAASRGRGRAIGVRSAGEPVPIDRAAFGRPTRAAGRAQLAWVDAACAIVAAGEADALVTGPVSKHAVRASGAGMAALRFAGHTEHLAAALGAREPVMAFWSPRLVVALATTHLPLRRVPAAVTPARVAAATVRVAELVRAIDPRREPRVAVCALNPHAGESGSLGDEERTRIGPGIDRARDDLRRLGLPAAVDGPVGAETAMRLARGGRYDAVVAMYHDQATIPTKLVAFGRAVNVTLGLPIVRTSVDHGTAYDIAGTGRADPAGMSAAIDLAARLARSRSASRGAAARAGDER